MGKTYRRDSDHGYSPPAEYLKKSKKKDRKRKKSGANSKYSRGNSPGDEDSFEKFERKKR